MKSLRRKLTVIIPVFNRESLILRCLDSVAAQDYRPLQIIVVDNGSTDDTVHTVRQWMTRHADAGLECILTSENRPGASAARQHALDLLFDRDAFRAKYDIISFFDSDDTMHPDFASVVMGCFKAYPHLDMVIFRRNIMELDGKSQLSKFFNRLPGLDEQLIHCPLATQGYVASGRLFREAGGWKPELLGWNDLELGMRILLLNPSVMTVPRALVDVYRQPDSITGTNYSDKSALWEKSLDEIELELTRLPAERRDYLLRVLAYRRATLAAHYAREGQPALASHLLNRALAIPQLSAIQKAALRLAYSYTKRGFRGAFSLVRHVL